MGRAKPQTKLKRDNSTDFFFTELDLQASANLQNSQASDIKPLGQASSSREISSAIERTRRKSVSEAFNLLSPFPHCVLPEHFFERYAK